MKYRDTLFYGICWGIITTLFSLTEGFFPMGFVLMMATIVIVSQVAIREDMEDKYEQRENNKRT